MRAAWRRRRADAIGLPQRGAERARVPGPVLGVEPEPGGGVVRFTRSELRITVAVSGAVFWGWDGAAPEPSYALAGPCPEPDPRAVLEPDKDGGGGSSPSGSRSSSHGTERSRCVPLVG